MNDCFHYKNRKSFSLIPRMEATLPYYPVCITSEKSEVYIRSMIDQDFIVI